MNRASSRASALAAALAMVSACGSGSSPAGPQGLHVAGSYQITKTGVDDTCGGPLTPVTLPGTVTHTAGATAFVLNDGFTAFNGTLSADGTFTIPPTSTAQHDGAPIIKTFEQGRFEGGVFTARVTLDVNGPVAQPPFPACRVVQAWRGVRTN